MVVTAASDQGAPQVTGPPLQDIFDEARRVVSLADEQGVRVRLIGGLAVRWHADAPMPATFERSYGDIDLVVSRRQSNALAPVMQAAGYDPNARFNALHGAKRLMFLDEANERRVDVFVGRFEMCHVLELDDRLPELGMTITLADLLLTKLQIVELNVKDMYDALVVLRDHPVEANAGTEVIDVRTIRDLCANDWGWYTTVGDSLDKLDEKAAELAPGSETLIRERIRQIRDELVQAKKSRRWKMRSAVGRRTPWYQLPEEV
jgi:hypothetical protein